MILSTTAMVPIAMVGSTPAGRHQTTLRTGPIGRVGSTIGH
jgi:hypothetical protein